MTLNRMPICPALQVCFSRTAMTQILKQNGLSFPYGHLCKMAISSLMIVEAFTNA